MGKKIKQPEGGLLQSKEWAELLRAEGKEIFAMTDDAVGTLHGVVHKLSVVGKYTYVPRACVCGEKLIDELLQKTKQLSAKWMRIDVCEQKILDMLSANGMSYTKAPHNMQSMENFIIEIEASESELLAQMKSKTRYNIRLSEKKGVQIFTTRDRKYIDVFCDLVEATASRKGVTFHKREHYQKMFAKIPSDMMQLYIARYDNKVIAANIISFYGGVATYLHGATSDEHRNVMAPFLLQWQAVKDAKERNCQWYDFGGVFPGSDDNGKKGITRFKLGFSPKTEVFKTFGSYDVILSGIKYKLYRILQKIK